MPIYLVTTWSIGDSASVVVKNMCTCPNNWLAACGTRAITDIEKYIAHKDKEVSAFTLQQTQELERWQRWLWQQHFMKILCKCSKLTNYSGRN
ncbi:hypothetical protein ABVN80_03595 [Acinetobacter baumannii]